MKSLEEIANESEVNESLSSQYDKIIESLQEAKENNMPLDEGLLWALVGGAAGFTFGPRIMNAICDALGINPKGALGSLMTSRLIMTAVAGKIGARI